MSKNHRSFFTDVLQCRDIKCDIRMEIFKCLGLYWEPSKLSDSGLVAAKIEISYISVPVKWSAEEQVTVRVIGNADCVLQLICHARGFPWPHFQWTENDKDIDCSNGKALVISRFLMILYYGENMQKALVWKFENFWV